MPDQTDRTPTAGNAPWANSIDLRDCTRIGIVTGDGDTRDEWDAFPHGARILVQDDGRTVKIIPAPPATLADELREAVSGLPVESKLKHQIGSLADRVEEMEERTRQAESYAGEYHQAIRERDEARAEVERLTAQVARQQQLLELNGVPRDTVVLPDAGSTPALPDPADVPAGEPWLVRDDQGLCLGLRCDPDDRKQPWCLLRVHNGTMRWRTDADVTLIRPVNISGLNPEETA